MSERPFIDVAANMKTQTYTHVHTHRAPRHGLRTAMIGYTTYLVQRKHRRFFVFSSTTCIHNMWQLFCKINHGVISVSYGRTLLTTLNPSSRTVRGDEGFNPAPPLPPPRYPHPGFSYTVSALPHPRHDLLIFGLCELTFLRFPPGKQNVTGRNRTHILMQKISTCLPTSI